MVTTQSSQSGSPASFNRDEQGMNSLKQPSGLREQNKTVTRRAIQRAAVELFEEQGYDATTVDDVASRANVAPRTFFRYFPSKELTLFSEDVSERLAILVLAAPAHLSPLAVLEYSVGQLVQDEPSELDRRRQILRQQLRTQPGVTRQFGHIRELTTQRLHDAFLRRFTDAGVHRPDMMASAIVAIHLGLADQVQVDATDPTAYKDWLAAVRAVIHES